MAVLWLLLLAGLPTFLLGVFVWVVIQNFPTSKFPSTLKHPAKLWFMHCFVQYLISLVSFLLGPTMGWGFSLKLTFLLSFPSLLSLGSYKAKLGEVSCLLPLTIPFSFPSFLLFSPLPLHFSSSFLVEK